MIYMFEILGRPYTKKNSPIRTKTGIIQSKQYRDYEADAIKQIRLQMIEKYGRIMEPTSYPVELMAQYYMPNRQGWPDGLGLLQATADILEKAGVITNDRQIIRIKDNTLIVGIDKDNPRTRIILSELKHPMYYQLDPWLHKKYLAGEYETSFEVID